MTTISGRQPAPGDNRAHSVMSPDEIREREEEAADTLPPADHDSVERSAGEGMVGTPVEAATVPTAHIAGAGDLLTRDGAPVTSVTVDLQVTPPAWAGTITVPDDCDVLATPGRYRLRLADGRGGDLTVTARASCVYTVEGDGPLDTA
jgi:hypothetical protein